MRKKRKVVDIVSEILASYVEEHSLELVDVEFVKEGQHRYLRVFIDKEGGVGIDDCQELSRHLNAEIDKVDPVEEEYFLEVSSPGVERPLKKDADFERFVGSLIEVRLYQQIDGHKIIEGDLLSFENGVIKVKLEHKDTIIEVPKDKIAKAKLLVRF